MNNYKNYNNKLESNMIKQLIVSQNLKYYNKK